MSDPVLDAYWYQERCYAISGPQPISIRDQMLRGVTVVERLLGQQDIGTDKPLVVVGAGAAGVSAAIVAAREGVPTTLVDRENEAIVTQRFATTRWLHPTQYDWPVDHHDTNDFLAPPGHVQLPLSYPPAWANVLSAQWVAELNAHCGVNLTKRFGRTITDIYQLVTGGTCRGLLVELDDSTQLRASIVIEAKGFGSETCEVYDPADKEKLLYQGVPFWWPDEFAKLRPGSHRVLISGSGDGALQDYLRIVTKIRSAAEIISGLNIPDCILRAVHSAEDRSHRGRSWASGESSTRLIQEAPYLIELEEKHRELVQDALADSHVRSGLARTVPGRVVEINIIYRFGYLEAYYGLNRFLTLLISEHIRSRTNSGTVHQTLFPDVSIHGISAEQSDHHECIDKGKKRAQGRYDRTDRVMLRHACFGREHRVTFTGTGQSPSNNKYNVIIVRHGRSGQTVDLKRPRHLLPYHLPRR